MSYHKTEIEKLEEQIRALKKKQFEHHLKSRAAKVKPFKTVAEAAEFLERSRALQRRASRLAEQARRRCPHNYKRVREERERDWDHGGGWYTFEYDVCLTCDNRIYWTRER